MTKLKYIKLLNGEDIAGLKMSEGMFSYTIRNPVQITSFKIEDTGEMAFEIVPWSYSANTDVTRISKKHIMAVFDAKQHLKEQYLAFLLYDKKREEFLNQPLNLKQEAIEQYYIKQQSQRDSH